MRVEEREVRKEVLRRGEGVCEKGSKERQLVG